MNKTATRRVTLIFCSILLLVLCMLLLRFGMRRYFGASYPINYEGPVKTAAMEFDVEPSLIYAIIHTESRFDPDALSHAGAKGLMQLTDDTFIWTLKYAGDTNRYTIEDVFTPEINIHYGVLFFRYLRKRFGNTETALAAYNAGVGRVSSWLKDPAYSADGMNLDTIPYPETKAYVKRVLTAQTRYQQLYGIA